MNTRLVFVVEDLDRNDSRTFDIQKFKRSTKQLKDFPNLSFVLTGGLASSNRIRFRKALRSHRVSEEHRPSQSFAKSILFDNQAQNCYLIRKSLELLKRLNFLDVKVYPGLPQRKRASVIFPNECKRTAVR